MPIQIYNTLSRKKEPFVPLNAPNVMIYNCGPTVYDHFHIGNARNFVVMDMVRRYFEYRGFKVRFVQNLTDIDDKIINRANDEKCGWKAIIERFIPAYFDDARKLRIRKADLHPQATEHIAEIIDFVKTLVEKGLAYVVDGSVYYRVKAFKDYGKLSGRKVEDLLEGARVEVNETKESPADFALWKAAKPGEPSWPSPWGEGRPAWHIECSVMATKHLGPTIDIHAGGSDLIFPHHENEIAQSEGHTGQTFARYWMHNGFLNIDNEKMSKSLGNFLKIDQVLERHTPAAVRYFLLSAHYRHPLDLTPEALADADSAVRRINDAIETGHKIVILEGGTGHGGTPETKELRERFEAMMDDDFNTPRALAVLFETVGLIHEVRRAKPLPLERLNALVALATELRDFFSLEEEPRAAGDGESDALVQPLMDLIIETRKLARAAKVFAIADTIRERLAALGVALEDHPQGTIWKRPNQGLKDK